MPNSGVASSNNHGIVALNNNSKIGVEYHEQDTRGTIRKGNIHADTSSIINTDVFENNTAIGVNVMKQAKNKGVEGDLKFNISEEDNNKVGELDYLSDNPTGAAGAHETNKYESIHKTAVTLGPDHQPKQSGISGPEHCIKKRLRGGKGGEVFLRQTISQAKM
jgi:hypothetical protein